MIAETEGQRPEELAKKEETSGYDYGPEKGQPHFLRGLIIFFLACFCSPDVI